MSGLPLYAVLAALGAPWWLPLFRVLLADVAQAGRSPEAGRAPVIAPRMEARRAIDADTRAPLNRVLAFRGVARRVAGRSRWEGGFGRRGL